MKDPRFDEFEKLRCRAVEIGRSGDETAYRELTDLLKSEFPIVRKAAAGAFVKLLACHPSLSQVVAIPLCEAAMRETGEQTLQYMLKALLPCAEAINKVHFDQLRDLVRNPGHRDYVRAAVSELIDRVEGAERRREARSRHWCTRCRRPVTANEASAGIAKYGKPYCHHCLQERTFEDIRFERDVEKAKTLRTVDGVAVQSRGERRIGDWLAAHSIAYVYDDRMVVAGDFAMRPDFYLPEFDVYIEYWGMDTPEYRANMEKKRFLYRRDRRRLVSISFRELDDIEAVLEMKLSRYIRL